MVSMMLTVHVSCIVRTVEPISSWEMGLNKLDIYPTSTIQQSTVQSWYLEKKEFVCNPSADCPARCRERGVLYSARTTHTNHWYPSVVNNPHSLMVNNCLLIVGIFSSQLCGDLRASYDVFVFDFRRVSLTREETDAAPLTGVVRTVSVFFYREIFTLYEMLNIHIHTYIYAS